MRERIEQIGGSLRIASNPGNGTTITAHLLGIPGERERDSGMIPNSDPG
jgi:signal transduction histidine kinase